MEVQHEHENKQMGPVVVNILELQLEIDGPKFDQQLELGESPRNEDNY